LAVQFQGYLLGKHWAEGKQLKSTSQWIKPEMSKKHVGYGIGAHVKVLS
jgi:hypothetical protein